MPAIDATSLPASALVLAGGRGERLERGVPKAAVMLAGSTLLERAVRTASAVASRVVVVAPQAVSLPDVPAARVFDPPEAEGPLAGIVAGMRSLDHGAGPIVVLGVDFPLIRAATLRRFLVLAQTQEAVLPAPGGTWQPLVAVYGGPCREGLERAWTMGERSITRAVATLAPRVVDDAELRAFGASPEEFMNVNTPQDLERAEAALMGPGT